jgi:hypothetical protein
VARRRATPRRFGCGAFGGVRWATRRRRDRLCRRVRGDARDDAALVLGMDVRFVACDEVRPERDPLTTERERTRESGTVADPTRREHGDRRNGGHGHRHELPDRRRAAHMSPSLDSLRDHGVDAHRYRCLGLLNGSNLNQHLEPHACASSTNGAGSPQNSTTAAAPSSAAARNWAWKNPGPSRGSLRCLRPR